MVYLFFIGTTCKSCCLLSTFLMSVWITIHDNLDIEGCWNCPFVPIFFQGVERSVGKLKYERTYHGLAKPCGCSVFQNIACQTGQKTIATILSKAAKATVY